MAAGSLVPSLLPPPDVWVERHGAETIWAAGRARPDSAPAGRPRAGPQTL